MYLYCRHKGVNKDVAHTICPFSQSIQNLYIHPDCIQNYKTMYKTHGCKVKKTIHTVTVI